MVRYKDTLWCDGCGIEIRWVPVRDRTFIFCCDQCRKGFRCECDDRDDEEEFFWVKENQKSPIFSD